MVLINQNPQGFGWAAKYGYEFHWNVLAQNQIVLAAQTSNFDIDDTGLQPIRTPLTLQIAFLSVWDGGAIQLDGINPQGKIISEEIATITGSDTIQSVHAYAHLLNAQNLGTRTAGNASVQIGDRMGIQQLGAIVHRLKVGNGVRAGGTYSTDSATGILTPSGVRNGSYGAASSGNDFAIWYCPA